jgi:peroxiredoxin
MPRFATSLPSVFLLAALLAPGLAAGARAADAPSTDKLGKPVHHIAFHDAAGKAFALDDLRDKKAIVVVFLSFDCPVSTSYAQPLADLAKKYGGRGVEFLGVCCAEDESAAQVAKHAAEYKLPFPVFKDDGCTAADAFKASLTPEAFVLDSQHILRYRGRIDDGYAARLKKNPQVTHHDLQQALDEILAGKPVHAPATRAVGCRIVRNGHAEKSTGAVTFYKDVLPILQNHCQTCHRPGEVGPFSLMTYRQAVNWAADIKDYTQTRQMPPWKPVAGPEFLNERKLSDEQIATLAAWVDGGTAAGDPADAPPPRQFVQGWQLGQPDLVLKPQGDFQVGASGKDIFRCFVLPTHLSKDVYVAAVEVRPSNPRVVHHSLQFIDTLGRARKLEKEQQEREGKIARGDGDGGPGYSKAMGIGFVPEGALAGWAPGQMPRYLPEGTGYLLPRGADVVVQVHYHRDGRTEKDRTAIGLYLAKKPVTTRFQGLVVPGGGEGKIRFFVIPAGNAHYRVHGSMWVDQDCHIHTVMPHMHLLGKEIKVAMTPPGGATQTLVAIRDWNYNWQETYVFKEPIAVKAGTRFDIEAFYDNSDQNHNNPYHPPRAVRFGEQTTNEMCFGFIGATADIPGRIRQRLVEQPKAGNKKS